MKTTIDGISQDDGPYHLDHTTSFNKIIVEAYQKEGLRSVVANGFAMIQQKVAVKGLKVLMDAKLSDGTFIRKGSTAYIKEETLHTAPWAQKILESDTLGAFLPVDMTYVEFVSPPEEPAA